MKKVFSIILSIVLVIGSFGVCVLADNGIKVTINGEEKAFDVMPQIVEGRTLVPMRGIFEAFDMKVKWIDSTKTVYAEKNDAWISLPVGETIAKVNGETKTLDVPAQIIEGRTMVPARFVAEALGCNVEWDAETKTVIIKEIKSKFSDERLPEGGEVIISHNDLLATASGAKSAKDGVYQVNVATKGEKDTSVETIIKVDLSGKILPDDVCVLNFKARLVSGGEDGKGYIKPYVQSSADTKWKKALFARTDFSFEWSDCYMPFKGIEDMRDSGIRFGGMAQKVEIKDFQLINYGKSVKIEDLPSTILEDKPSEEKKSETPKQDTTVVANDKVNDAKLSSGGNVLMNMSDFVNSSNNIPQQYGNLTKNADLIIADIKSVPEKQADSVWRLNKKLSADGSKAGDTMMITFKARLISGGRDGKGYIKVQLEEPIAFKKAIFASTSFGSEWTTCYMPFVQINGADALGFRVAPIVQKFEIKDIQVINFGTEIKLDSLPSTICADVE